MALQESKGLAESFGEVPFGNLPDPARTRKEKIGNEIEKNEVKKVRGANKR